LVVEDIIFVLSLPSARKGTRTPQTTLYARSAFYHVLPLFSAFKQIAKDKFASLRVISWRKIFQHIFAEGMRHFSVNLENPTIFAAATMLSARSASYHVLPFLTHVVHFTTSYHCFPPSGLFFIHFPKMQNETKDLLAIEHRPASASRMIF